MLVNNTMMSDSEVFQVWGFIPDEFQKQAMKSIQDENHTLITAHTGSGKTFPAEYAIKRICEQGKKVIYTSPIKSLSNQKFNEFSKKHTDISFGILTGDIKFNPEADCLIMTTEILRNTLYHKERNKEALLFDMDFQNDLACVIFDEVHYINDTERGKVWEECIMLLPSHVFTVMLSATISNTHQFATWIQKATNRKVQICSNLRRVIPLVHQVYMTVPTGFSQGMSSEEHNRYTSYINSFVTLKDQDSKFNSQVVHTMAALKRTMYNNNVWIKASTVIHRAISVLKQSNLLPAICFVFSRKYVERYASNLHINLSDDSNAIEAECESIIKKIPNYKEYMDTSEYKTMLTLLRRGIAIHHSGIIPILKEVVEILFSKGLIKILFATETFAVGVNMPAKTVMFANFQKYSCGNFRDLLPHEYTQMAGRAGRRGIDNVGYVIHLLNIVGGIPTAFEYAHMVTGPPQQLLSKFNIDHNLMLKLLLKDGTMSESFINKSMMSHEIEGQLVHMTADIEKATQNLIQQRSIVEALRTNKETLDQYSDLHDKLKIVKNKQKNKIKRELENFEYLHKSIVKDFAYTQTVDKLKDELTAMQEELTQYKDYTAAASRETLSYLKEIGLVTDNNELTDKGLMATHIQEINCIIAADMISEEAFDNLMSEEIAALLSVFTTVTKTDCCVENPEMLSSKSVIDVITFINNRHEETLSYNLCDIVLSWCQAKTEKECMGICEQVRMKGIFIGDFVKALLKINSIAREIGTAVKLSGNVDLVQKLSLIPELTLKYLVSNQSIYI